MTILLDIDGVLVTTPSWKATEQLSDGFMKFNDRAAKNLARIIDKTDACIVLTTTHRIRYSVDIWKVLLGARGIAARSITKVNEIASLSGMSDRATEIQEWVAERQASERFVIIDDDSSLNDLPIEIRSKCVLAKSLIGLDDEATMLALSILQD